MLAPPSTQTATNLVDLRVYSKTIWINKNFVGSQTPTLLIYFKEGDTLVTQIEETCEA